MQLYLVFFVYLPCFYVSNSALLSSSAAVVAFAIDLDLTLYIQNKFAI